MLSVHERQDWFEFAADGSTVRYHSDDSGSVWLCCGTVDKWLRGSALPTAPWPGEAAEVPSEASAATPSEVPRWALNAAHATGRVVVAGLAVALLWLLSLLLLMLTHHVTG